MQHVVLVVVVVVVFGGGIGLELHKADKYKAALSSWLEL